MLLISNGYAHTDKRSFGDRGIPGLQFQEQKIRACEDEYI